MEKLQELPDMPQFVQSGIRKGRVPREGYYRGWGLQFGSLQRRFGSGLRDRRVRCSVRCGRADVGDEAPRLDACEEPETPTSAFRD